jgi:hypothetical protein
VTGNFVRELLHAFAAASLPPTVRDTHPLVGPNGAQIWYGVTRVGSRPDSGDLAAADDAFQEPSVIRVKGATGHGHADLAPASSQPAEIVA